MPIGRFHPLWLNQASFTENADKFYYHELYIYFLTDASCTVLYKRRNRFASNECCRIHTFERLRFDSSEHKYFCPKFLKKIFSIFTQNSPCEPESGRPENLNPQCSQVYIYALFRKGKNINPTCLHRLFLICEIVPRSPRRLSLMKTCLRISVKYMRRHYYSVLPVIPAYCAGFIQTPKLFPQSNPAVIISLSAFPCGTT